jgi:transcriptional regulator with XRE-family HTH domain
LQINLRTLRTRKNLTLLAVARELGCTKQAVWKYENGERRVPLETAPVLAKLYGVTTDEIISAAKASSKRAS